MILNPIAERHAATHAKGGPDELTPESIGAVASFNGRGGHVMPQSGDYTAGMVGAMKVYRSFEELGLTEATATPDAIVNAMGDYTIFRCYMTDKAMTCPLAAPFTYGLLTVTRLYSSFTEFRLTGEADAIGAYGYYNSGATPSAWSGWLAPYSPYNKPTAADVGAAPAGYGYGDTMPVIVVADEAALETKLNEILDGMEVYTTKQFLVELTTESALNGFAVLSKTSNFGGGYAHLNVCGYKYSHDYNDAEHWNYVKVKRYGSWSAIEHINPYLASGKEYRTTERIAGKAVYLKNVSGVIQYRLDGETEWKPYAQAVGGLATDGSNAMTGDTLWLNNKYGRVISTADVLQFGCYDEVNKVPLSTHLTLSNRGKEFVADLLKLIVYETNGQENKYTVLHTGNVPNVGNFITGSYVGTGTCGAEGKTEINFPFEPKYVVVFRKTGWTSPDAYWFINPVPEINGLTYDGSLLYDTFAEWEGKTLRWWFENSGQYSQDPTPSLQANVAGTTYYYAAWG